MKYDNSLHELQDTAGKAGKKEAAGKDKKWRRKI